MRKKPKKQEQRTSGKAPPLTFRTWMADDIKQVARDAGYDSTSEYINAVLRRHMEIFRGLPESEQERIRMLAELEQLRFGEYMDKVATDEAKKPKNKSKARR